MLLHRHTQSYLALMVCVTLVTLNAQSLFELDGDPTQNAVPGPEDWELLYDGGANTGGSSLAFTGILPDPGQDTIFTGGRKDIQDITDWRWKSDGGFPDKNDITNAYAAAYTDPGSGDLIVYFGADRFANCGDAFMGFWFFKELVTLNENGTFDGRHTVGDILILINYPQGTPTGPEVQILEWNPEQEDIAKNLCLLLSGSAAACGMVPPQSFCATTNTLEAPSPWPYVPKSGTPGFIPYESFFEGGVNLFSALGVNPCFSSFLAETRSSTSLTATLKDFVIGEFPVCRIAVTKSCDVVSLVGGVEFQVDFAGSVTNTGAGSFPAGATLTVVDDAGTPGQVTDDVTITEVLQSPMLPGGQIPFTGSFLSDFNPPLNTVDAWLQFGGEVVASESFTVECLPIELHPALSITQACQPVLETVEGKLVVRVDYSGDVTNAGDVPLTVTIEDSKANLIFGPQLMQPGDSDTLAGSYFPIAAMGQVVDPAQALFSNTLTGTGTSPVLALPVVEQQTEHCTLCPP